MVDLVIEGGRIVSSRHTTPPAWVAVENGKIVALGSKGSAPPAKKVIDATGLYVLPGVVDPEHHRNRQKFTLRQGLFSETKSALASGITTTGFMTHSNNYREFPATFNENSTEADIPYFSDTIPEFIECCKNNVFNDFFFIPELSVPKHAGEMYKLAEKLGIVAFKLYLHWKSGPRLWDMNPYGKFQGALFYDDETIWRVMKNVAALGRPSMLYLHCENYEIAKVFKDELLAQGRTDVKAWTEKSPTFIEAGHLRNYAYYAKIAKCPIVNIHTTNTDMLAEIVRARADGAEVYGCTQPTYLTLDEEAGPSNVSYRTKDQFEPLWKAIKDDIISQIHSDNYWVGRSVEDWDKYGKTYPFNVFDAESLPRIWGTGPHAEFLLPTMLSEGVNKGRISLEKVVEVCCENTARRTGLYPKKGAIMPGADADFALVDIDRTEVIKRDMIVSAFGWSYYEGWEFKGWPVMTILRGNMMMEWPKGKKRIFPTGPIGQWTPAKAGHEYYPLD